MSFFPRESRGGLSFSIFSHFVCRTIILPRPPLLRRLPSQETFSAPQLVTRVMMRGVWLAEKELGWQVSFAELADWSGWCARCLFR